MAETERSAAAVVDPTAAAAAVTAAEWRLRLALALMVASGFAGLGYQIVWTQQASAWLGHETAAVLAVVAAFFGGLALGALTLAPRIERSAHPARWYAACEAVIGLWSLALALLMAPAGRLLLDWTGAQPSPVWQWTVAFAGTFALLLPATAAMGATLPAMERVLAALRRETSGSSIAALYAGNTLGAVVGVLAAAFWLVPGFGLTRTAAVCAALNLLCAAATLLVFPRAAPAPITVPAAPARGLARVLAATGLLGIGYEVLVVRVLSQVSENTVYTFAMLLAVYLVGTALGAAAYHRWRRQRAATGDVRGRLLVLLAAACLAGSASLWAADAVKAALLGAFEPSLATALGAEAALALIAFLPATVVMGALFSHLAIEARTSGLGFGRGLGVNTLGAAAAPPLFGVVLLPLVGPKFALIAVAAGYLALSWSGPRPKAVAWALGGVALALAAMAPPLAFVDVPEGGRVVSYRDGAMAAVSVVEDADGVATLRINNRQQEGS
ncbi:MAG: spermidine synthase, partial [Rubrivivax sp.]|nr:spermidine synthase [Rubrivivax sp.]